MESIIQDKKECFKTGCTFNLHKHHIWGASNRNKSEKYGLFIYLRSDYHNLSNYGIHFDKEFDLEVKKLAQTKAMEHYNWSIDDFRKIFGKNYI